MRNTSILDNHTLDSLNPDLLRDVRCLKNLNKEMIKLIEQNRNNIINLTINEDEIFFIKFKIDYFTIIRTIKDFLSDKQFKEDLKQKINDEIDKNKSDELEKSMSLVICLYDCCDLNNQKYKRTIVHLFEDVIYFLIHHHNLPVYFNLNILIR